MLRYFSDLVDKKSLPRALQAWQILLCFVVFFFSFTQEAFAVSDKSDFPGIWYFDVDINVQEFKQNGSPWDGTASSVAPEIVICLSGDDVGARCFFNHGTAMAVVHTIDVSILRRVHQGFSPCKDSYDCFFNKLLIQGREIDVEVWDLDFFNHDLIGEGPCEIDARMESVCHVGLASVSFFPLPKFVVLP